MELVKDNDGNLRQLHANPRLLPMVDTWEALNLSKTLLYFLACRGVATRDEIMEVLQSFTQHAPDYLLDELHQRQEALRYWLSSIPVDKKHQVQRDSGQAAAPRGSDKTRV